MDTIDAAGETFTVRRAEAEDVPALVVLLADDMIGSGREQEDLAPYLAAFAEIDADPRQFLAVVEDASGGVCGTLQLTLVPGLSRRGSTRLQIEAVRLAGATRGRGLGTALFAWAHEYGRHHGAALAELTTDKSRVDAHRFYDRLGYRASHEGYKLEL
ncbi:GNAT family N-acetyltransferase [Brachybacterium sp. NPDC056505]|uniref:GNAT family N-acetyltransferase n=1 Tax=Brachybacterium sp. NPDC056505 TaxID=3345843 RepID=UPI00366A6FC5